VQDEVSGGCVSLSSDKPERLWRKRFGWALTDGVGKGRQIGVKDSAGGALKFPMSSCKYIIYCGKYLMAWALL
jgi:hypothetical protein